MNTFKTITDINILTYAMYCLMETLTREEKRLEEYPYPAIAKDLSKKLKLQINELSERIIEIEQSTPLN